MGITEIISDKTSRKRSSVKSAKEIEKWRKKRSNRTKAVFNTGIVFMFSIYFGVLENDSLFIGLMVIGICSLPFLVCLFLLRYAEAKVKK